MTISAEFPNNVFFAPIISPDDNDEGLLWYWPCVRLSKLEDAHLEIEKLQGLLHHGSTEKREAQVATTKLKVSIRQASAFGNASSVVTERTSPLVYRLGKKPDAFSFGSFHRVGYIIDHALVAFHENVDIAYEKLSETKRMYLDAFNDAIDEAIKLADTSNSPALVGIGEDTRAATKASHITAAASRSPSFANSGRTGKLNVDTDYPVSPLTYVCPSMKTVSFSPEHSHTNLGTTPIIAAPSEPEFSISRAVFIPTFLPNDNHRLVPWPAMLVDNPLSFIKELQARKVVDQRTDLFERGMQVMQEDRQGPYAFNFGNFPCSRVGKFVVVGNRKDLVRYDQNRPLFHNYCDIEGYWKAVTELMSALTPISRPAAARAPLLSVKKSAPTKKKAVKKEAQGEKSKRSLSLQETNKKSAPEKGRKKKIKRASSVEIVRVEKKPDFDHKTIESIPVFEDVQQIFEQAGYTFQDGCYYLPCVKDSLEDAEEGTSFFTSESEFREYLCVNKIPLTGMDPRKNYDALKPLETWVIYHRVDKLLERDRSLASIRRLHNKDARELHAKIGILWKGKSWEVPGMEQRLQENEFCQMLAAKGIPESCNHSSVLSREELLSLEFHIVDYKNVLRFHKHK